MQFTSRNTAIVALLVSCIAVLSAGCAHGGKRGAATEIRPSVDGLKEVKMTEPVLLRLKADPARVEQVAYLHKSNARAFEDSQLRNQKEESLEFVSQAETKAIEPADKDGVERFTQILSVTKKDGIADLHDFAMPELGERLEIKANSLGQILSAGDYPPNSIFYVAPISLPKQKVSVGDTWTMQAAWLSLEEMIPYQIDMVSILKGFWECGSDTCAEIELSGEVGFNGPLSQAISFKSTWRGKIFFALKAGTVVWSRTDSEERVISDNTRRDVESCLEAVLQTPEDIRLPGLTKPTCDPVVRKDTELLKN